MYDFNKVINRKGTNCKKYDFEKAQVPNMIPKWVADMDFETLPEVKEAIINRVQHGVFGYSFPDDEYYDAVINWMKVRHNFHIEKDWIVTTPGIVTALKVAVKAYTKKHDNIIVHKPVYYPFDFSVELNDRNIVECPLTLVDQQYQCDFKLFEKRIIENDVKMFILCNPHNPVGKVWKKEELYQLGMICKKHGVIVVSDEIHMDFVYQGNKHIPFYNVDESFKEFSIICTAPSKTFNLAALQTSNIIIANKELKDKFEKTEVSNGINVPNVLGLEACKAAYKYGNNWVDELIIYLQDNINYMINFFEKNLPQLKVIKPEGLYLVWVDMRALNLNDEDLETFMLDKALLWLDEGYIFGSGGNGFERFNVACPRSILEQALNQLKKAIEEIQ